MKILKKLLTAMYNGEKQTSAVSNYPSNISTSSSVISSERSDEKSTHSSIHQYFRDNLFNKFVSILVTACFIISIVNLPAFSMTEKDIEEKLAETEKGTIESVSSPEQQMGAVSTYHSNLTMKKEDYGEGYLLFKGDKFVATVNIITNDDGTKDIEVNSINNEMGNPLSENSRESFNKKYKEDIVKDVIANDENSGYPKKIREAVFSGEAAKEKQLDKSISKPEENNNVSDTQTDVTVTEVATDVMDSIYRNVIEKGIIFGPVSLAYNAATSMYNKEENNNNGQTQLADEQGLNNAITNTGNEVERSYIENKDYFQKEQELIAKIEKDFGEGAESIIDDIATLTGLEKEQVYNIFKESGVTSENFTKETKETLRKQLGKQFENQSEKGIATGNVSVETVAKQLNISKEEAVTRLIASDIASGEYAQNNKAEDKQITISLNAKIKELTKGLKKGDSAVISIDKDKGHVINVTKNDNGTFTVKDLNVNDGKGVVYTEEEFNKLINKNNEQQESQTQVQAEEPKIDVKDIRFNEPIKLENKQEEIKNEDNQINQQKTVEQQQTQQPQKQTVTEQPQSQKQQQLAEAEQQSSHKLTGKQINQLKEIAKNNPKAQRLINKVLKGKGGFKTYEDLTPEQKAKVDKIMAKGSFLDRNPGLIEKWTKQIAAKLEAKTGRKWTLASSNNREEKKNSDETSGVQANNENKDTKEAQEQTQVQPQTEKEVKDSNKQEENIQKEETQQKQDELSEKIKEEFGENGKKLIAELSEQTGLSEEETYKIFKEAGVTKEKIEEAYPVWDSLKENGVKNSAAKALSDYTGVSIEKVATELIAIDIAEGIFTENNEVNDKQIKTSMYSQEKVFELNEKSVSNTDDSISRLQPGDGATVHVNNNHYIVINKEQTVEEKIKQDYEESGYELIKEITDKANSERKEGEPEITLEQVYNEFKEAGVTKEQLKEVSDVILSQISNGARIINCSAASLSEYLGISSILASIQQLAVDIAENIFLQNNKAGDSQIKTSMYAQQKVCELNGKSSEGYEVNYEDFKANLKEGESAIVWVNGSHYITISKEKDGNFGVVDINVNGGNKVIYTEAEFDKLMNNQEAVGRDAVTGKEVKCKGYKAIGENGKLTVLTDSKSVAEKGTKISAEKMKTISGADYYTTVTYTVYVTERRQGTYIYKGKDGKNYKGYYYYTVKVPKKVTKKIKAKDKKDAEKQKEALRKRDQAKEDVKAAKLKKQVAEQNAKNYRDVAKRAKDSKKYNDKAKEEDKKAKDADAEIAKAKENLRAATKEANKYLSEEEQVQDAIDNINQGIATDDDYNTLISTETGKAWLNSKEGQDFLKKWANTQEGKDYLKNHKDFAEKLINTCFGGDFFKFANLFLDENGKWSNEEFDFLMDLCKSITGKDPLQAIQGGLPEGDGVSNSATLFMMQYYDAWYSRTQFDYLNDDDYCDGVNANGTLSLTEKGKTKVAQDFIDSSDRDFEGEGIHSANAFASLVSALGGYDNFSTMLYEQCRAGKLTTTDWAAEDKVSATQYNVLCALEKLTDKVQETGSRRYQEEAKRYNTLYSAMKKYINDHGLKDDQYDLYCNGIELNKKNIPQDVLDRFGLSGDGYHMAIVFGVEPDGNGGYSCTEYKGITKAGGVESDSVSVGKGRALGVEGTYNGQNVATCYIYERNNPTKDGKDNWESYTEVYNISLLNDKDTVYQPLGSGGSGGGSGSDNQPTSMTSANISINPSGATASGANSVITINSNTGKPLIVAKGSHANAGSRITQSSGGHSVTVVVNSGATYTDSGWEGNFSYMSSAEEIQNYFTSVAEQQTGRPCTFGDLNSNQNLNNLNFSVSFTGIAFDLATFCCSVNEQNNGTYGFRADTDDVNGSYYGGVHVTGDVLITGKRDRDGNVSLCYRALQDNTSATVEGYHVENGKGETISDNASGTFNKGDEISAATILVQVGGDDSILVNDVDVAIGGETFKPGELRLRLGQEEEKVVGPDGKPVTDENGKEITKDMSGKLVLADDMNITFGENGSWTRSESSNMYWKGGLTEVHLDNSGTSGYFTGVICVREQHIGNPGGSGDDQSSNSSNNNAHFYGKYDGNVATGVFVDVDSRQLSEGYLYGAIYSDGSILETGSLLPDGVSVAAGRTHLKKNDSGQLEWDRVDAHWTNENGWSWEGFSTWCGMVGGQVVGVVEWIQYAGCKIINTVANAFGGSIWSDGEFRAMENRITKHLYGTDGFKGSNVEYNDDGTVKSMDFNQQEQHVANVTMEKISIAAAVVIAAIAITVCTGGLGIGAFSVLGSLIGTAAATSTAAIAITTAATAAMAVIAGMELANSYVAYNDAKITLERKEQEGTATKADRDALTAATVGLAISAVFAAVTIFVPVNIGDAVIDGIAIAGTKLGSKAAANLLAKQIGRRAANQAIRQLGKEGTKKATQQAIRKAARNAGQQAFENVSKQIIENGGKQFAKEFGKQFGEQFAREFGKQLGEDVVEQLGKDLVKEIGMQASEQLTKTLTTGFLEQGLKDVLINTGGALRESLVSMAAGAATGFFGELAVKISEKGGLNNLSLRDWNDVIFSGIKGAVVGFALRGSRTSLKNASGMGKFSFGASQGLSAFMMNRSMDSARYNIEQGNYGAALFDIAMVAVFVKVTRDAGKPNEEPGSESKPSGEEPANKPVDEGKPSGEKPNSNDAINESNPANDHASGRGGEPAHLRENNVANERISEMEQSNANIRQVVKDEVVNNGAYDRFLNKYGLEEGKASKLFYNIQNAQRTAFVTTALYVGQRVAGNISEGKNPIEGIGIHEVITMYVGGFILGGALSAVSSGFMGAWGENIESVVGDVSLFSGEESLAMSAVSLSKFTAVFDPLMSAAAKIFGAVLSGRISEIDVQDIYEDAKEKYINTFLTSFEELYGTKDNIGSIPQLQKQLEEAQERGDDAEVERLQAKLENLTGWQNTKSSFATGLVMSPVFRMAMPGQAMFAGRTGRITKWLDRGTSAVAESGNVYVALVRKLGGETLFNKLSGNILFNQINMALTMKQFEQAGEIFGSIGRFIDDSLGIEKTFTNQKGEKCGIFEFFLETSSMLFVPTGMSSKTMKKYAVEDMNKLDIAKAKVKEAEKELSKQKENTVEYKNAENKVKEAQKSYNDLAQKIAPRILENSYGLDPMKELDFISEQQTKVLSDILEVNNVDLVKELAEKIDNTDEKLSEKDLLQIMLEGTGIDAIDFGKELNPLLKNSVVKVTVEKIKEYEGNIKNVEDYLKDYNISKDEKIKQIIMDKLGLDENGFDRLVEIDRQITEMSNLQYLTEKQESELKQYEKEREDILEGKINSEREIFEKIQRDLIDKYGLRNRYINNVEEVAEKLVSKEQQEINKEIEQIEQEINNKLEIKNKEEKSLQNSQYIDSKDSTNKISEEIRDLENKKENLQKELENLEKFKYFNKYFSKESSTLEDIMKKVYQGEKIENIEDEIIRELRIEGLTEEEIEYNLKKFESLTIIKEEEFNKKKDEIKNKEQEIEKIKEEKKRKIEEFKDNPLMSLTGIDTSSYDNKISKLNGEIIEIEKEMKNLSQIREIENMLKQTTLDRIMESFGDDLKTDIVNEFFRTGDEKNAYKYASEIQKEQFEQAQQASAEIIQKAEQKVKDMRKDWDKLSKEERKKYNNSFELYKLDMAMKEKGAVKHEIIRNHLDYNNSELVKFLEDLLSEQNKRKIDNLEKEIEEDLRKNLCKSDEATKEWQNTRAKELGLNIEVGDITIDFYSYQTIKFALAEAGCYGYGKGGLTEKGMEKVYENMFGEAGEKLYKKAQREYSADTSKLENISAEQLEALFDASMWSAISSSLEGGFLFSRAQYMGIEFIFKSLVKPAFEMSKNKNGKLSSKDIEEIANQLTEDMKKLKEEFGENASKEEEDLLKKLFENFGDREELKKAIESGSILKKINVFGTGAGKTAILSTLFPAVKLVNDINGDFTIISVDVDTNISNLMSRITSYFGSSYDILQADKDNINGVSTETALFMTYTDFGFAMLEGENVESPIKGKVGIMLCDEADMIVYVSKVMMSDSGGFEQKRSDFFDWFMGCVEKDGKYATIYQETKTALEEYFSNAERGKSADGDSTYNELLTYRDSLRSFVENGGEKPDLSAIENSLENLAKNKKIPELKTKMTDLDKAELLLDMTQNLLNSRAKELLKNGKNVNGKSKFDEIIEEKFIKEIEKINKDINKNDVFGSEYTLEEIAHNMFEADLTWVEGIDYGIGKDAEGKTKVMLISGGALADLIPAAGFKQIIEARKLANGEDIAGITAIGNQKQVSTSIIKAIGEARGMIGLTGTFKEGSASSAGKAFEKIEVTGNYFTEPTEIKNIDSKDHTKTKFKKMNSELELKWKNPYANTLEMFEPMIETMCREGADKTLMIQGMDQATIALFKKYCEKLGVFDIKTTYEKDGKTIECTIGDRIAWFDATMSKSAGDGMAKNKDGKFLFYIGTNEQLGRGVDIQAPEDARRVQLNVINPHLSYKSAIEQLIGRVGGTRFAEIFDEGNGIDKFEINIMSDIETIKANAGDIETNMITGDISGITTENFRNQKYFELVQKRVYGDDFSGRIAEDQVVMQSGATIAKDMERARRDDFLREKQSKGEEAPTVKEVRERAKNGGYGFTYGDPIIEEILKDADDDEQLTNSQWFAVANYARLLSLMDDYDEKEKQKKIRQNKDKILSFITTGNVADIYEFAATDDKDKNKIIADEIRKYEESYNNIQEEQMNLSDEKIRAMKKVQRYTDRFKDKSRGGQILEFIKSFKDLPGGIGDFMGDPITNIKLGVDVLIKPLWNQYIRGDNKNAEKARKTLNTIRNEALNQYLISKEENRNKNTDALKHTALLSIPDQNSKNFGVISFANDETIKIFEDTFEPGSEDEKTWSTGVSNKVGKLPIINKLPFNNQKEFDAEEYLELLDRAERAEKKLAMNEQLSPQLAEMLDIEPLSEEEKKVLEESINAPKKYLEDTGHKNSNLYKNLNNGEKIETAVDSIEDFAVKVQKFEPQLPKEIVNSKYENQAKAMVNFEVDEKQITEILKENGYVYPDGSLTKEGKVLLTQILFALSNEDIGMSGLSKMFSSLKIDDVNSIEDMVKEFITLQKDGILLSFNNTGVSSEELFHLLSVCKYDGIDDLKEIVKEYKENGINGLIKKGLIREDNLTIEEKIELAIAKRVILKEKMKEDDDIKEEIENIENEIKKEIEVEIDRLDSLIKETGKQELKDRKIKLEKLLEEIENDGEKAYDKLEEEKLTTLKIRDDKIFFKTTTKEELNKKMVLTEGERIIGKEVSIKDKVKEIAKLIMENKGEYEDELIKLLTDSIPAEKKEDVARELKRSINNYEKKNGIRELEGKIEEKKTEKEKLEDKEKALNTVEDIIEDIENIQEQINSLKQMGGTEKKVETKTKELQDKINELKEMLNSYSNEFRMVNQYGNLDNMQLVKAIKKQIGENNSNIEKEKMMIKEEIEEIEKELKELGEEFKSKKDNGEYKLSKKIHDNIIMDGIEQQRENNVNEEAEKINEEKAELQDELNSLRTPQMKENNKERIKEIEKEIEELNNREELVKEMSDIAFYLNKIEEYKDKNDEQVVNELNKKLDKLQGAQKTETKALVGVTRPKDAQEALKALFALFDNPNEIAQMFGYDTVEQFAKAKVSKEEVMNKYTAMVNRIDFDNTNEAERNLMLLNTARDVMLMLSKDSENKDSVLAAIENNNIDELANKLIRTKAVNMNVIIRKVTEKDNNGNFVIDLTKIKEAVEAKEGINTPKEILKKLAAGTIGKKERSEIKKSLMSLSDIHAVAAAA